ncbi:heme exporter protein CcmD [Pseudoduganella sp. FT25W]|uniref:Heme exporter protein D n=1 Tax=Duganella alba TaxID=2666081 RepID=A0A6L5QLD6_9BURK|nr:heme exporter protein CcmD [Duganella alba]MRX10560.1 heme exporter protein CcmD [Duganella alba]MRX18180.1 heme exporter protein CcmD [Duganella alba]
MIWNSVGEFWAMGGYALYVWGSMAVVALCLGAEVLRLWQRHAAARALTMAAAAPARRPAAVQRSSHGVQDEATA